MEVSLNPAVAVFAALVIGFLWKWAREKPAIDNRVAYALAAFGSVGVAFWAIPDLENVFVQDWRAGLLAIAMVIQQSRGGAAGAPTPPVK